MRDINFEKLTKRAIAVYTLERAALVKGDLGTLQKAELQKNELLADIELAEGAVNLAPTTPASVASRAQLTSLHSIIARRVSENDQLARANKPGAAIAWRQN